MKMRTLQEKDNTIKVSVCITTYNHEKFIAKAIESALMQKVNFDYEILIGEDDSSDGTREIAQKYKDADSDKIKLFLNDRKNVIYINGTPTGKWNMANLCMHAKGQYIAFLEGDDYWTATDKLQSQVDFLDDHPEYPICFTDSMIVDENENIIKQSRLYDGRKKNLSQREILSGLIPPPNTVLLRRDLLEFPEVFYNCINGDMILFSLITDHGDAAYIDTVTACYRMHANGIWAGATERQRHEHSLKTREALYDLFGHKYNELLSNAVNSCKIALENHEKNERIEDDTNYNNTKFNKNKHILISGTNFWNPGDDFVRDGIINVLKQLFDGYQLNFLFYNFNQDFFPQSKFSGIMNMVSDGDLEKYGEHIDFIIVAGLSAGNEIKPLYSWIIKNNLQDRVYLIGAGYENQYVDNHIRVKPEATIFRNAKVIIGRTEKKPAFISENNLTYYHINCPAILSVNKVKDIHLQKKIKTIAFSIQLPHNIGISNHCCSGEIYKLSIDVLVDIVQKGYKVEIIAHHKTEYFHFLNLFKENNLSIPVVFSSFYQDLYQIYPRYDLIITTRLHASLFANGHGIPGIILNDTDRHTHCLENFPHSVWANTKEKFDKEFEKIRGEDLQSIALETKEFKRQLMNRYVTVLKDPFGVTTGQCLKEPGAAALPILFFTIVLNGEPFIRHHIEVFKQLPFRWHWHIVEGVADLKHDTAWSVAQGGRITEEFKFSNRL